MVTGRANFAIQVIKNSVYVFGGIQSGSVKEAWRPTISTHVIEKYLPQEDIWIEVTIPNVPSLAAFSWTTSTTELFIFGGSDGALLTSDLYRIDFQNGTCKFVETDFDFSTGMGHLIYREKADELHHIGGFNSFGVNYSMKLGTNKW